MKHITLTLVLMAAFAVVPAKATTVYIGGNFGTGGTLSGGSFHGEFDIDFPVGTSFELLSSFDVILTKGSTTVEIENGQTNSNGEVFANMESTFGALNLQFIDNAEDFLDLFFTIPFTGNAPILTLTSTGYESDGGLDDGTATRIKAGGVASLSPLPEPGTWWLTGAGGLLVFGSRWWRRRDH